MLPEEYGGKAGPMADINRNIKIIIQLIIFIEHDNIIMFFFFFYCFRPMVRKNGDLQGLVQGTRKNQS